MRIRDRVVLNAIVNHGSERVAYQACRYRKRKGIDDADARLRRVFRFSATCLPNCTLDAPCTQCNLNISCGRTRYSQHQCRGVPEVAIELNGARTLRQLAVECVQLQVNVGKLLFGICNTVVELDIGKGESREAQRSNTEISRRRRLDVRILRQRLFHWAGNQL